MRPHYRVQIERRAQKALDALPRDLRRREEDLYRLRVGGCRVLYAIRDAALLALVVRIADRREVYR